MTSDDIFAVTTQEGGDWKPLDIQDRLRIHSILFTDGDTWDEINGFRGPLMSYTKRSMEIVRENWDRE